MSILIKGMEMPKSCWECEVGSASQLDNNTCPFYVMDGQEQENYQNKIAEGCPISYVPPHTRSQSMKIDEAAQILKDHCLQSDCRDCCFSNLVNENTQLEFYICNIGSPSFWNLDGNFDGLKEANRKFCEIAKGIAEDEDLQHVGYTDEQLGREK